MANEAQKVSGQNNDNHVFIPKPEYTKGQPAPIAANNGLSFMSFDRNGDGGSAAATAAALDQIRDAKNVNSELDFAHDSNGGIRTKWGLGFTEYDDCVSYINTRKFEIPEGGVALPLRYSINERPSYSIVPSNALWTDRSRTLDAEALRQEEEKNKSLALYFPKVLKDARRISEYYPGLSPTTPECMDKLGVSLAHCQSECKNFYDAHEVEKVFYPEIERLLLEFFPDAIDALVYNHDVFDKDYQGDRTEDQDNKNPGINANYVNLVHNDLNDNSGRLRCQELLTKNLRNFGREQNYSVSEAEEKMSRRFMSINLAKPMETVEQYPFVLCAWPSFADQPYITNYRVYDDRVGETTRFTHRDDHEWYWFPRQTSTEVSMLKCYDSVTDGSVSRWSFHSACIDPTAAKDAACRKNVVVRSYVFF